MQVTKNKLPKGQIELQIELSVEEIEDYFKKTLKKLSQETRLDGFRPGKVPEELIKKRVGDDKIMAQAGEMAIQKTMPQALEQEQLVMIASPKIDIIKQARGNPFIYRALVSLLPEVKLGDYKSIKVKKKNPAVEEAEVKKTMESLQKMKSKEVLVNREARKGDKVEVKINVYQDKVPLEGGQALNQPIIIGEEHFIPGFEEKLIGMKKEEEKEFELRFPKDYFQKNLVGKLAEFKVKINSVFNIELPKLDDEFAHSFGNFKTIKELEEQIKKNLIEEAKIKERQRQELEILEKISERSKFDELPEALLESEIDKMLGELKYDFERQNLKFEDYLASIKKSEEELRKSFLPRAEKRVRAALIIRKISETEQIEASEKEIEKELEISRKTHQGNEERLKQVNAPDYKSFVRNVLVNQKVLDKLLEMAVEE